MFDDLMKAAVSVAKLPVTAVADAVTLGGVLTDKPRPYTAQAASDLMRNLDNATKPDDRRRR